MCIVVGRGQMLTMAQREIGEDEGAPSAVYAKLQQCIKCSESLILECCKQTPRGIFVTVRVAKLARNSGYPDWGCWRPWYYHLKCFLYGWCTEYSCQQGESESRAQHLAKSTGGVKGEIKYYFADFVPV